MYAVVKTGGKQYKVSVGQTIRVERLAAEVGSDLVLDQVLALSDGSALTTGSPLVAGVNVTAKVTSHGKGDKIRIFKMRRRKHYKKSRGHRQPFTELQIASIGG